MKTFKLLNFPRISHHQQSQYPFSNPYASSVSCHPPIIVLLEREQLTNQRHKYTAGIPRVGGPRPAFIARS
jgi:hypothetical protein